MKYDCLAHLDQLVVRAVDHGLRNVLIHEEQQRQGEPEQHPRQNYFQIEIGRIGNMENFVNLQKIKKSPHWKDSRMFSSILQNYLITLLSGAT